MNKWTSPATPIAATFSKDARFFAADFTPTALRSAVGSRVIGDDGRGYMDWISSLGAITLGHAHTPFCDRVAKQLYEGIGFSLPHILEAQVAKKIVTLFGQRVPGWTPEGLGVRFGLSGTDATTMAVRLARAASMGEHKQSWDVISIGYHGWADWSVSVTQPAWGVTRPQHVMDCPFNDANRLEKMLHDYYPAAVIVEHGLLDPDADDFYREVRALCHCYGATFILDEIVTWPRYGLGGIAELYGVEPDIVCLGKGLGNGLPISCIVGRREYFGWFARDDPCFVSSTHFGNAVSLAAADAVLDLFGDEQVAHIWRIGQALMDGLLRLGFRVVGHPPRFLIDFPSLSEKTYFVLGMRDRQILWNRPTLPNLAHTMEDVERTVEAARQIQVEMEQTDVEAAMADRLPMVLFSNR